jgi:hypothetical protein
MKNLYFFFAITGLLLSFDKLNAQTIWTGPKITFTKTNGADWNLPANQDRITNNVWITRANTKGIFNIVTETVYKTDASPADTKWAFGTTSDIDTLKFNNWENAIAGNPLSMINRDMVLYLITDSVYIDIKFTSWTSGGAGGGFSYERSADQSLSFDEFETNNKIKLFPNPVSDIISISGVKDNVDYKIFNLSGTEIYNGTFSYNGKIDIKNIPSGLYFFKFQNGNTIKLVKK